MREERWWVARARGVKETPHARAATDANVARVYAHAVAQVSAASARQRLEPWCSH